MKNGEYKIEKGIEIPNRSGGGLGYGEVLRKLKPGESVLLPIKSHSGAWTAGKYHIGKGKFVVRKDGDGHRIWRTAE